MMIFMSLYSMVDGIFVSRLVNTDALSAINIVVPFTYLIIGVGVMFGTGGSAIIAKKMGEGDAEAGREAFSLIVLAALVLSAVIMILGLAFREPVIRLLGASDRLMPYCRDYYTVLLMGTPAFMLQLLFQNFFVTAGKPNVGLWATVGAGLTNILLDYLFIGPLGMGIQGAAIATALGYLVPAVAGLFFFCIKKNNLYFVRPKWNGPTLLKSCANGSSEMVTNLASAVIAMLFNIMMIRLLGEDGVAAITIVLYGQFIFTAIYLGFSSGVAPVVSYQYGARNTQQLQRVFKISLGFITVSSLLIVIASIAFAPYIVGVFADSTSKTYELACHGFVLFSTCYIFTGYNIFASSLFTALSNGKVSAILSFMRTFVLILPGILVLPAFLGVDGIWLAVPIAEALGLCLSVYYLMRGRERYRYA